MEAQSLSVLDLVKATTTPTRLKSHCSLIWSNCANKRRSVRVITSTWDQLAVAVQEDMVCRKFTSSQSHLDRFSRCLALPSLLSVSGCVTCWSLSSTSMEHTAWKTELFSVTRLEQKNCRLMDTCVRSMSSVYSQRSLFKRSLMFVQGQYITTITLKHNPRHFRESVPKFVAESHVWGGVLI